MRKFLLLFLGVILGVSAIACNRVNQKVLAAEEDAQYIISFKQKSRLNQIKQSATGWLYGLSENDVPSLESIEALKPKVLATKNKDGLQHPTGDAWRVADTFFAAGGKQLQIYLTDYYPDFPYNGNIKPDMQEYLDTAVLPTVRAVKAHPQADKWAFVPFNESDWIWFDHDGSAQKLQIFCEAWLQVFTAIKAEWSEAVMVGPNYAYFDENGIDGFMSYCKTNNCLPDVVSWHELENNAFDDAWYNHIESYRNIEQRYNIPEKMITVNEYAEAQQCSVPGELVKYISGFESEGVYACLPYWNIANNLDDLMADYNSPNSAWQLYKWYADMGGTVLNSYADNTAKSGLKGLTSYEEDNKRTTSIFGGTSKNVTIRYNNFDESVFASEDKVHITVETAHWSGYDGIQDYTAVIFDNDVNITDNTATISLTNMNKMDAYKITLTQSTGSAAPVLFSKIIEAESEEVTKTNAAIKTRSGLNTSWEHFAMSYKEEGINIGNYNSCVFMATSSSSVSFAVDAPKDGLYKLDVLYGTNTREYTTQKLTIDEDTVGTIKYDPTINISRIGKKSIFFDLTQGVHTIKIQNSSLMSMMIDRFDIYQMPENFNENAPSYEILARSGDVNGTVFSEGKYISGFGKETNTVKFVIVAEKSGFYDLTLSAKSNTDTKFGVTINHLLSGKFNLSKNEDSCADKVFLEKGVNIIDINANNIVKLSKLTAVYSNYSPVSSVEFESGILKGTSAIAQSTSAMGGEYVSIGGGTDNFVTLTTTVTDFGKYKLMIYYSSNDAKGSHAYNVDTIDPYVQLSINGGEPKTYYFRSSYHWDRYITRTIDVELIAGENTFSFYNDNIYQYNGILNGDSPTPRLDKLDLIKITPPQEIIYLTAKKPFNAWYIIAPIIGATVIGGGIGTVSIIKRKKKS